MMAYRKPRQKDFIDMVDVACDGCGTKSMITEFQARRLSEIQRSKLSDSEQEEAAAKIGIICKCRRG